jgi:hypothetical protein
MAMSALDQKQTSEHNWIMSALPPKADIAISSSIISSKAAGYKLLDV